VMLKLPMNAILPFLKRWNNSTLLTSMVFKLVLKHSIF
jgi:hypothetical protein